MKYISLLSETFEAPEFQKWVSNCNVTDKRFYLDNNISLEMFVHIGKFIFPNFIEIDGLIFIEELVNPAHINPANRRLSLEEYQASFNRLNLAMYFSQSASSHDDLWNAALEIIKAGWLHSLEKLYPNIEFVVETSHEDAYDPYIWFYQKQA